MQIMTTISPPINTISNIHLILSRCKNYSMLASTLRWEKSVAVVTGASAGIGAAIVRSLINSGLTVVGLARRQERLDALSDEFQASPNKFYGLKTDISKTDEVQEAFKWITETLGPVAILINNAGILKPTNLINGDIEHWRATLNTNVLGLCAATSKAIQSMQVNKIDGQIIHINSIAGHFIPELSELNVYPATKHAITALTETLRRELIVLGSKIKITSISPGLVNTELFSANGLCFSSESFDMKFLEPEDIAAAVLYVLSTPPHVQIHELTIRPVGETI